MLALYELGGAEKSIDVEAIYLRAFEIAPARFSWRTRPDLPDYKKVSKALQSVEATTHVGLVLRVDEHHRRLTPEGAAWTEQHLETLKSLYGGSGAVEASSRNEHEALRRRVKASPAFAHWKTTGDVDIGRLAPALECSPASPAAVWEARCSDVIRAGTVLVDSELEAFGAQARATIRTDMS